MNDIRGLELIQEWLRGLNYYDLFELYTILVTEDTNEYQD